MTKPRYGSRDENDAMKRRALTSVLIMSVLLLPAVSAAYGQDRFRLKEGARGRVCLECHADFEETLALPFVHTPVKGGACADCHSPHASRHGKLLAAEPDEICARCHEGLVPEHAASVHAPVAGGQCVQCHDPHAASNPDALRRAANDLCAGCHADLVQRAAQAKFVHSPVGKSCLTCHDPHASPASGSLLKKPVPELCVGCHRTDQQAFRSRHMGYPVGSSSCTSCHDPHGSGSPGILWANVHEPLVNRMCGQCHMDAASPDALQTKQSGYEICRGCHAGVLDEIATDDRVHWPVLDSAACLNCHSPHASKQAMLLREPVKPLCGSCHQATLEGLEKAAVKHPPAAEGECSTCHAPHASNAVFLLRESGDIAQCGTCHDWKNHSTHPIGEAAVDPRNQNLTLACMSCHQPHGSAFRSFTHLDPDSDLCVQCHTGQRR